MIKIYLACLLLFSCCGRATLDKIEPIPDNKNIDEIDIDEELKPFVKEFISDMNARHKSYEVTINSIKYVDKMEGNTIGMCYYDDKIEILKVKWHTKIRNRLVMYHELGHCLLNLAHTPNNSHTIMQPVVMNDEEYIKSHWSELVDGLVAQPQQLNLTQVSIE